jgi:hypothetical protein
MISGRLVTPAAITGVSRLNHHSPLQSEESDTIASTLDLSG